MMVAAIEWGDVILLAVVLPFIVGMWIVQGTALFPEDSIWTIVRRLLIIAAGLSVFALVVKVVKILFTT
jgi:hypothetical protein